VAPEGAEQVDPHGGVEKKAFHRDGKCEAVDGFEAEKRNRRLEMEMRERNP
jgi:hypothetical protein